MASAAPYSEMQPVNGGTGTPGRALARSTPSSSFDFRVSTPGGRPQEEQIGTIMSGGRLRSPLAPEFAGGSVGVVALGVRAGADSAEPVPEIARGVARREIHRSRAAVVGRVDVGVARDEE